MRRRKGHEDFFSDLALIEASDFLDDCDELIHEMALEAERQRRYQHKRQVNAAKALRIHKRFQRVMAFDPWKATAHIPTDVFGDNYVRLAEVKRLMNKQLRISWILWAIYHYWMFDVLSPGSKKYGKRYSLHRKLWYRHIDALQEKILQDRWNRKRERVRARRNKEKLRKRNGRPTADETLAILKSKTQKVIEEMESPTTAPEIRL